MFPGVIAQVPAALVSDWCAANTLGPGVHHRLTHTRTLALWTYNLTCANQRKKKYIHISNDGSDLLYSIYSMMYLIHILSKPLNLQYFLCLALSLAYKSIVYENAKICLFL